MLSPFRKHRFLGFILCLLALNLILALFWEDTSYDRYAHPKYAGVVVALMLLFNHIAFYYTTIGWQSRVMKTVAWIWIFVGCAYILWLLGTFIADTIVPIHGVLGD